MMRTVYFAKHIYLESGRILDDGAIAVEGGMIAGIGPRDEARFSGGRAVDLGDMLLLPGFINIHTHLEENTLRGFRKEPEEPFAAWSSKKHSRMRRLTADQIHTGVRLGAREMLSNGITTVADTTRTGISAEILASEPIRSVIFMEVADEALLEEGVERVRGWAVSGLAFKYGIAPHAFYSISPQGHRRLIDFSRDSGCLWACHAAESAEEVQAFCGHSGDFFFNLTRNRPWPAGGFRLAPVQYAFAESLIPPGAILHHCNYADGRELALLAGTQAFITHCYRYNSDMEFKNIPIPLSGSVRMCLGTEGMAPAGKTNFFDDLFHLKMSYPHISAVEMLRWVTQNPAAALKSSEKLGSLSVGKCADIIGVRFSYDAGDDILETLLLSDPEINFVIVGGEEVIV